MTPSIRTSKPFQAITIAILLLSPAMGCAQSDLSKKEVKELTALKKELEGTYQVQMLGTDADPSLMLSVYEKIAEKRDDKEVVHYQVDEHTRIKILPKERIRDDDFEGVKPRVTYIEEGKKEE